MFPISPMPEVVPFNFTNGLAYCGISFRDQFFPLPLFLFFYSASTILISARLTENAPCPPPHPSSPPNPRPKKFASRRPTVTTSTPATSRWPMPPATPPTSLKRRRRRADAAESLGRRQEPTTRLIVETLPPEQVPGLGLRGNETPSPKNKHLYKVFFFPMLRF